MFFVKPKKYMKNMRKDDKVYLEHINLGLPRLSLKIGPTVSLGLSLLSS